MNIQIGEFFLYNWFTGPQLAKVAGIDEETGAYVLLVGKDKDELFLSKQALMDALELGAIERLVA